MSLASACSVLARVRSVYGALGWRPAIATGYWLSPTFRRWSRILRPPVVAGVATIGDARKVPIWRGVCRLPGFSAPSMGTGGRVKLLGISNPADPYLRTRPIHSARTVLTGIFERVAGPICGSNRCWRDDQVILPLPFTLYAGVASATPRNIGQCHASVRICSACCR